MYIVMFEFVIKEGFEEQFIKAWPSVTQGIYLFKGSLGSRLHKNVTGEYIAYAQWPNQKTWEVSSEIEMSPEYEMHRESMRESLNLESTKFYIKWKLKLIIFNGEHLLYNKQIKKD